MTARDDGEVERLKEEARWHWDRAERAEAENAQLTEALARVRELHRARRTCGDRSHTNPTFTCPSCAWSCEHCGVEFPCSTIEAIGDES